LPTIWRAAAAKLSNAIGLTHPATRFRAAAQPIVGKPDSYGLRPESKAGRCRSPRLCRRRGIDRSPASAEGAELNRSPASAEGAELNQSTASAEGVGVWLADDLARSGSKTVECHMPDTPRP